MKCFSCVFILTISLSLMSFLNPKPLNILAVGDSNGVGSDGWVAKLGELNGANHIYNTALSGNTVGFNNRSNGAKNTLSNINRYMNEACKEINHPDVIIIMLGTNDCKAVYKDNIEVVKKNFEKLVKSIKNHPSFHADKSVIFLLSPPPYGQDEMLDEKYKGGCQRIPLIQAFIKELADKEKCVFVDIYSVLLPVFRFITSDGIHLTPEGQKMVALVIQDNLKYFSGKQ